MNKVIEETRQENLIVEKNEEIVHAQELNFYIYKLKISQKIYIFFKSIVERLLALLGIVVLSPVLIVLAIAVKCSSKGPVFFKQERIGKKRKIFKCFKFRSMTEKAPHYESDKTFAAEDCITKIGKFMRKTSLDELGQLFNVLSGKMSLIGYRPLILKEKEMDLMRMKKGIYQIKPGITGWAQINGRTQITDEEKANYDEYYLQHVSLWIDIKICFKTFGKMLNKGNSKNKKVENK